MIKNSRLLIVDDEPLLAKILEFTLKDTADVIFTATNGNEAISIVMQENIHCILCDMNLPTMNGIEIIRRVRTLEPRMPFVFFSGVEERNYLIEAARMGAIDFLFKPHYTGLKKAVSAGLQSTFYRPVSESPYGKILRELNLAGPELS